MNDNVYWSDQPGAGWTEFVAARARFLQVLAGAAPTCAPEHVGDDNGQLMGVQRVAIDEELAFVPVPE